MKSGFGVKASTWLQQRSTIEQHTKSGEKAASMTERMTIAGR